MRSVVNVLLMATTFTLIGFALYWQWQEEYGRSICGYLFVLTTVVAFNFFADRR